MGRDAILSLRTNPANGSNFNSPNRQASTATTPSQPPAFRIIQRCCGTRFSCRQGDLAENPYSSSYGAVNHRSLWTQDPQSTVRCTHDPQVKLPVKVVNTDALGLCSQLLKMTGFQRSPRTSIREVREHPDPPVCERAFGGGGRLLVHVEIDHQLRGRVHGVAGEVLHAAGTQ